MAKRAREDASPTPFGTSGYMKLPRFQLYVGQERSNEVYYHAHKSKEAALRTTFMPTLELDEIWPLLFITQYGSTVYIGIAMVYPH